MRKTLALYAVLAISLTACSGGAAATAEPTAVEFSNLEELVAAAESEGSVRLYTSLLEPDLVKLVEEFEATYDIDIEDIRLGGSDAMNRFDSESAAKSRTADIVVVNDTSFFGAATEKGTILPLEETGVLPLVPDFPSDMLLEEEKTAVLTVTNNGLVYNSNLVDEADAPDTWEDLLDPRWTGKILAVAPESSLANILTWSIVSESQGEDYLSEIGAQIGRYYPNLVPMHEALAAGEGELAVPSPEFFVAAQTAAGQPLAFKSLSPNYYPAQALGVATAAEHPAAARLLAQFLMSEDGISTITSGAGVFSPYDDGVPADFRVPGTAEIQEIQSRQDEIVGQLKK
ncbi:ABC transporter substrate-binding protein [Arthrobacter sp. zg-Y1219]|uniref:ABC transporter substrate-binding protein n=1 Tax=Arthrobacter sp. zg-Y1219 TaxID=3049067 RepID=UPI0024C3CED2|nr:ABC transporter substrate-binding protein [Arthrobacter sp. zg-Y1219]MDK1361681.1 ABC transporter substrate-binding protein [Arthrobacter sp. zg-Y1219]